MPVGVLIFRRLLLCYEPGIAMRTEDSNGRIDIPGRGPIVRIGTDGTWRNDALRANRGHGDGPAAAICCDSIVIWRQGWVVAIGGRAIAFIDGANRDNFWESRRITRATAIRRAGAIRVVACRGHDDGSKGGQALNDGAQTYQQQIRPRPLLADGIWGEATIISKPEAG